MRNTWFLLVAIAVLFATIATVIFRRRKKKPKTIDEYRPLANTKTVRDLPEFASARKKYHLLLVGVAVLFLLAFGSSAVLVARPVSVSVARPAYENRDIMLCLDISGSMSRYIEYLSDGFINLIENFEGQRFGVTIFDGSYMNISPLTDDYDSVIDLLGDIKKNLSKYSLALATVQHSYSEIGPGLVGCINGFNKLDEEERTRTIILATDNYASSTQAVNLTQAANYAKRYNITVYGLSTGDSRSQEEIDSIEEKDAYGNTRYENSVYKEFRKAMLATGGSYYALGGTAKWDVETKTYITSEAANDIIKSVMEQAVARSEGVETLVRSDSPGIPAFILCISLILFLGIIWRLGI